TIQVPSALSPWRHFSQLTSWFPGTTVSERQTQQRSSSPGRAAMREQSVRRLASSQRLHPLQLLQNQKLGIVLKLDQAYLPSTVHLEQVSKGYKVRARVRRVKRWQETRGDSYLFDGAQVQ
ncbi:hypothetical protein U0070_012922, partial [Myodes glareolus]